MTNDQQETATTPDLFDAGSGADAAEGASAKPKTRRAPRKTAANVADAVPTASADAPAEPAAPRKRKPKAAPANEPLADAGPTPSPDGAEAPAPKRARKRKAEAEPAEVVTAEATTTAVVVAETPRPARARRGKPKDVEEHGAADRAPAAVPASDEVAGRERSRRSSATAKAARSSDAAPSVDGQPAVVPSSAPVVTGMAPDGTAATSPITAASADAGETRSTEVDTERRPRRGRRGPGTDATNDADPTHPARPAGESRPARDAASTRPARDAEAGTTTQAAGADTQASSDVPAAGGQPQGTPGSGKRRRKPRDRRGKREGRGEAGAQPGGQPGARAQAQPEIPEFVDEDEDDYLIDSRTTWADSQQIARDQRNYFAATLDDEELDEDELLKEITAYRPRDRGLGNGNGPGKGPVPEDFPRREREAEGSAFTPPAGRAAIEQIETLAPKLQKVLADAGIGSRREMEELILAGRVSVNGEPAHIGQRVEITDQVRVNGKPLQRRHVAKPPRVIVYHKPAGEIVSNDDPEKRATVFERLPQVKNGRWVSVGRLDFNTEGLLIFTTSGELANRLMHPKFGQEREYAVRCIPELEPEARRQLLDGVTLDDGPAKVNSLIDAGGDGANHWYHVTIGEGRNREVRRLFEAVGATVSRLIRVRYGDIDLPRGLKRGRWAEASPMEAAFLCARMGIRLAGDAPQKGGKHGGKGQQPKPPREISPLDTMTEAMFGVSPVKNDKSNFLTTHVLTARQGGGGGQQQRRRGGIPGMPGMDGPPDGRPGGQPRGPKPGQGGGNRGQQGKKAGGFAGNGKPNGQKFGGKANGAKKSGKPGGAQAMAKPNGGGKPQGKPGGGRPGGKPGGGQKGQRGPKL
ncbi:23S rRNA pseudouridine(2605) synthase RluB [Derxia gummosa]|uniref:Pseudouridine synthase n=1 Tax=Derxia gummosa DSM 723 TaxID=1121388 RepID=A0A9U5GQ76_9BURK|nr:pseudouridine synthase [Derxia gummosa]